ncbi:MAG: NAD(+) synthase [Oscillospiraceae bacterium]
MKDGFIRAAASSPEIKVGDCKFNRNSIFKAIDDAQVKQAALLVLPELCVTSYTCGDLFLQQHLLDSALSALMEICEHTKKKNMVVVAGLPISVDGLLYNCAAVIAGGELLGLVPKTYIPNYTEFYEQRYFAPAPAQNGIAVIDNKNYPFGQKLLFRCRELPKLVLGVEICEDLFATLSPSSSHSLFGATVIANPSASDEVAGKPRLRREIVAVQSAKSVCGYVYCNAPASESTTDVVYSAHNIIAENGTVLAESAPFCGGYAQTELDIGRIDSERRRLSSVRKGLCFTDNVGYKVIEFSLEPSDTDLSRKFRKLPFVPDSEHERKERCEEILNIQCAGLIKRLEHTGCKKVVIGISGGLDSTLALLVCCRAFDMMHKDRSDIITVSMPCYGTTNRTKSNAQRLCSFLETEYRLIDITKSVELHLSEIGHAKNVFDAAFENAQARERTQVLMDISNMCGGIVLGTGDLSEQALGWSTYNGDHMSMYAVNTSVPKTLVRHLVEQLADEAGEELRRVLHDILATPISPELIPSDGDKIEQKTEDIVGPYELHDFFLYYVVRWGFPPKKIFRLAKNAFEGEYEEETIKKWLTVFYKRFFSNQFKRSCVPDGPKVGSVSLSPRGDFKMPSDASAAIWLCELTD